MRLLVLGLFVSLLPMNVGFAQSRANAVPKLETYESAAIDATGRLVITTSDKRTLVIPKARGQSSFSVPVLSADRTAVGAQAEFPNCCTSYDIPLQLVIYADRKVHRFSGNGLPIFRWHFADGGTRIAFGQEPVHFGCEIHYELRDVRSERLAASVNVPEPCGARPQAPEVKSPDWVITLENAQTK